MTFTFLDMAGKTLFVRDDAERAEWTLEEQTINLDFPFLSDKVISTGQRVYFKDENGDAQIFEVKTAKTVQPEAYQQITAEHICISELTDEHMEAQELTDTPCQTALNGVLSGTLWRVGNVSVNPVSTADLPRGSVWQAIIDIQSSWNVYIVPRVTISVNGSITRYLDIKSTDGVWNGIRLSIDKNLLDPSVTYDDTELATALYGYGGTINGTTPTEPDREVDFSEVVWTKTADHPAKPAGQKYLEDPEATAAYGRNGRARFGYYQNSDIEDPETLLEKTWETLKTINSPAISIEGTVADLYRMGYADQPIRLHDIALVEVLPAGFHKQLQIIRATVNLLDPSETVLTIGAYIPNIIYIDRETSDNATGVRGGGGNKNSSATSWQEFRTQVLYLENGTGLRFQAVQNDINHQEEEIAVQSGRIDVAYNKIDLEVIDRREADNVLSGKITVEANRITQEVTRATSAESSLSGRITVESNRIGLVVSGTGSNAKIKAGQIVVAINEQTGTSIATIAANRVRIAGNLVANDVFYVNGNSIGSRGTMYIGDGSSQITLDVSTPTSAVRAAKLYGDLVLRSGETTLTVDFTTLSGMVKSFSVSNNTLTLTPFVGSPVNFSKAVTLSGSWGSGANAGKFTVTASPQGNSYYATVYVDGNGNPSKVSGWQTLVEVPVKVMSYVNGSDTPVETNYTKNQQVDMASLLQEKTFTTNGEKSPDSGYIGFSKVTVNFPSYTGYTMTKTRTQDSSGYHYTFACDTGWTTPFGTSGGTYTLYKKG